MHKWGLRSPQVGGRSRKQRPQRMMKYRASSISSIPAPAQVWIGRDRRIWQVLPAGQDLTTCRDLYACDSGPEG